MGISTADGLSDHVLMACVVRGDEAALAALYDRYHALVFTIALRITGDHAVAEEVLQDVFYATWRAAGGFRSAGSVAAWLIGIARHRAIDATRARLFRARGREQRLEPLVVEAGDPPEEQIDRRMDGERLRAALAGLPFAQRQALELIYYGEMTQAEVAAHTGAPVGTVKTRLRLGLLHLRRALAEGGPPAR
jgi:RNA polymerase sigma-70 factor (ECF subfamily)